MLSKLGFRMKIGLLIAVAMAAVAIMAVVAVTQARTQIIEARQETLVTAVQAAHNIAVGFQARAASGAMSKEEAQKAAREAIKVSRYGGADGKTEYFYIWTTEGGGVMHPFRPEWDGQP
jgi:methyl-accepting chemotaxis protein